MARGRNSTILLFVLLGAGLSGCGQLHPPGKTEAPARTEVVSYTVKPGDTLYSISWRYGYDYREVAAWNRISAPYTIYTGQVIRMIPPSQQTTRSSSAPAQAPSNTTTRPASRPTTSTSTAAATTPPPPSRTSAPTASPAPASRPAPAPSATPPTTTPPAASRNIAWQWPTQGEQRYGFNLNAGKKGIGIGGSVGQAIYAAADGDVVYSGSGLIGYGNLLIIKHDDVYLSAYGHNRRLLVQEGARVKRGQQIAEMGESSRDGAILHFEIRRDGNPVNPLGFLPKAGS